MVSGFRGFGIFFYPCYSSLQQSNTHIAVYITRFQPITHGLEFVMAVSVGVPIHRVLKRECGFHLTSVDEF
jgi:hypothetical protein